MLVCYKCRCILSFVLSLNITMWNLYIAVNQYIITFSITLNYDLITIYALRNVDVNMSWKMGRFNCFRIRYFLCVKACVLSTSIQILIVSVEKFKKLSTQKSWSSWVKWNPIAFNSWNVSANILCISCWIVIMSSCTNSLFFLIYGYKLYIHVHIYSKQHLHSKKSHCI